MHFKKAFLILLFLHMPQIRAMEYGPEEIFAAGGLLWALKVLPVVFNHYKVEIEFERAIAQACESNFAEKDVDAIKKCLTKDIDPNCKIGSREKTILMFAIENSNDNLLEYLFKKNDVDMNASDALGWTPLHYAMELQQDKDDSIKYKGQKICKKLLKLGANPNNITKWVAPPLFYAIQHGYNDTIKLLIQYNANINDKKAYGITPLAYGLEYPASLETIKQLCEFRASPYNIDHDNNSVFHVAVYNVYSKESIQALMKYGHFDDDNMANQKQNENMLTRALKTLLGKQRAVVPLHFQKSQQNQKEQLKKTIMETLLVLKQQNVDPYCQFCILSHVALLSTSCGFNKKFCEYLFTIGQKKPFVFHINNQVKDIIKTLQIKNDKNKTALDLLNTIPDLQYKEKVKPLVDAHGLQNDLDAFNKAILGNNILDNNNVISEIFSFKLN